VEIAEVAVVAPDLAVRLPIDPGTGLIVNEVLPRQSRRTRRLAEG
jgi:hypothetical protein